MLEQPDPKHKIPENLEAQEVYKGVPFLAFQDEDMQPNVYGLSLVWYDRIIDIGHAALGKPWLDLVQQAKNTIDMLLEVESQGSSGQDETKIEHAHHQISDESEATMCADGHLIISNRDDFIITLDYSEAYSLFCWLVDYHSDMLYKLVKKQEPTDQSVQQIIKECVQEIRSWQPAWPEDDIFYAACGAVLKKAQAQGIPESDELLAAIQVAVRQALKTEEL